MSIAESFKKIMTMDRDEVLRIFSRYIDYESAPLLGPTPERPTPHELLKAIREASRILTHDEYTISKLTVDLAVERNIM